MYEQLQEMGLTNNEIKVYLTLLDQGTINVGKLTSKSGVHRRSVYDALDRLIEKGIVGYIKENNIKHYSAQDPKKLLEILRQKQHQIQSIIPELEAQYERTKKQKETLFFRGKEGIKHIFEDQIKSREEILIIGGSSKAYDMLKYYLPHYERERKRNKIKTKIIFDTIQDVKIANSEIKYVDHSLGPAAINVYGKKVAIIVWSENPYAILIDDEDVALTYRQHFEMLWQ